MRRGRAIKKKSKPNQTQTKLVESKSPGRKEVEPKYKYKQWGGLVVALVTFFPPAIPAETKINVQAGVEVWAAQTHSDGMQAGAVCS